MSVALGKTYSNGIVSMRRTAFQPQEGATLQDSLFAAGEEALLASPVSSLLRSGELEDASFGKPLAAEDARRQIDEHGLTGHLTVPDQGVPQAYLDILIDRKQEELKRAEIIQSAPQGAGATAARFSAGFAASMLDPINIASAFVPVVSQARYLKWLGRAGSFAGRTGVRAGVGAAEGVVGAALVEPLIYSAKAEEQADYDSADSLANIAFGTVFGGGLHVMGGSGADLYRKVRGATNPWDLPELKAGREAHAAVYDDIESQLRASGRPADEAAANASLVASAFRGLSEATGRSVDDLYAEFGPRISFAREGEFAYANGPGLRTANQIADQIAGRTFNQPAYHGSPHDFDKFSLDKIGTGEGAQAYGWGLYFAENPGVAGEYQRSLSSKKFVIDGRTVAVDGSGALRDDAGKVFTGRSAGEQAAVRALSYARTRAATTEQLAEEAESFLQTRQGITAATIKAAKDFITGGRLQIVGTGRLYQVDIADEAVAKMLDWDKPLSEQPESVRKALRANPEIARRIESANTEHTGRTLYGALGGGEGASKLLRDIGIPGIRYLDQGSRLPFDPGAQVYSMADGKWAIEDKFAKKYGLEGKTFDSDTAAEAALVKAAHTDGTRNLVVFDDSIVKITHKDGSPVTAAERKEFLQSNGGLGKRGSIDLAKGRRVNITLFEKADRSTFLHETGHLFLEVLDSIAVRADAPEAIKADMAKVREWVGLKEGEAFGEAHHEQFARGLEAYVREGKAPTPTLRKVFERFRDWLVGIYKDAKALNVTLSDDVRGVYDRLIAGYPAAKKVELAGPAKREAALRAAVAQTVTGKRVDVEGVINGDQREVMRAAKNPVDALQEPPAKPLEVVDDDTSIESARESLGDIEATIKASGDEAVIRELDDLDEVVVSAKLYGRIAKKLAPCIGATDG